MVGWLVCVWRKRFGDAELVREQKNNRECLIGNRCSIKNFSQKQQILKPDEIFLVKRQLFWLRAGAHALHILLRARAFVGGWCKTATSKVALRSSNEIALQTVAAPDAARLAKSLNSFGSSSLLEKVEINSTAALKHC